LWHPERELYACVGSLLLSQFATLHINIGSLLMSHELFIGGDTWDDQVELKKKKESFSNVDTIFRFCLYDLLYLLVLLDSHLFNKKFIRRLCFNK
jgi:hypothetical protein